MKTESLTILQESSLRATAPRIAVLEALRTLSHPEDAQAIHARIKRQGTDLVTVYRALASFEQAGIVRRVDLRRGSALYVLSDTHHHHIVCTDCGTVEDFDDCGLESIAKRVGRASTRFAAVGEHSLELYGTCLDCAQA